MFWNDLFELIEYEFNVIIRIGKEENEPVFLKMMNGRNYG